MASVYEQFSESEILEKLEEFNTKDVLEDLPVWTQEHPDDPPVGFAMMQDAAFATFLCKKSGFQPPPTDEPQIMAGCISRHAFVQWVRQEQPDLGLSLEEAEGELGVRLPVLYATRNRATLVGVDHLGR